MPRSNWSEEDWANIEKIRNKIDAVFDRAEFNGPRTGKSDDFIASHTFSGNTSSSYRSYAKEYAEFVYKHFDKINDVHFYKPRFAEAFIQSKIDQHFETRPDGKPVLSASGVRQPIHALQKLQSALRYQYTDFRFRIINTPKMLEKVDQLGIKRRSVGDDIKKTNHITPEQADKIIAEFRKLDDPQGNLMADILQFQKETGSRISAALNIRVRDIKSDTVKFNKDKGSKTRITDKISPEFLKSLRESIGNRKDGRAIFELKKLNGELMSTKSAREKIEREFTKIARKLGLNGANTHSMRKVYAKVTVKEYEKMSRTRLKKEIVRKAQQDRSGKTGQRLKNQTRPREKGNYKIEQIINKVQNGQKLSKKEQEKLDMWRKDSTKRLLNQKRPTTERLDKKQLAILATSIQIGHNRRDVMKWYV